MVQDQPEIIQDMMDCMLIRLSVTAGEQTSIVPAPWIYYPLLSPNQQHPVNKKPE